MLNMFGNTLQVCLALTLLSQIQAGYKEDNFPATVLQDALLTTPQLLSKYKYPNELHFVTTEDKYILQLHRISRPGAKPVLLVHGILDSSATWILMGPNSSLGYYLYDAGYDVWLGNVRGNRYSRNHTTLDPDADKEFWNFSWHEIGVYDLPAMVDAVLQKTGFTKLSYFGHSQGTTSFFVMCSMRPSYNQKIHIMQALAPVAFCYNMKAPLLPMARSLQNVFGDRRTEVFPYMEQFYRNCLSSQMALQTCLHYCFQIWGQNPKELNMTMVPVVLGHIPAGCSLKQGMHYIQLTANNRFCQFDYEKDNKRIYGRATPPDYPLQNITVPVALHYAQNDYLASVEDVQRLAKLLPNVVANNMYPDKRWNHIDMCWGISSRRVAQPYMLQLLRKWEQVEANAGAADEGQVVED